MRTRAWVRHHCPLRTDAQMQARVVRATWYLIRYSNFDVAMRKARRDHFKAGMDVWIAATTRRAARALMEKFA